MRRKEFAARVWSKLVASFREARLLRRGDKVLAAVSGGPDSVCLAHLLATLGRRHGFTTQLLHVHHGLRGQDSDRDARFVLGLAESLGLTARVVKVPVRRLAEARGRGIEDAARKLRYAALASWARRLGCSKVATGHQMDDQAETVLLNLLRGTRLAALAGIPARRPLSGRIELVRPLLVLSRAEVMAYLKVHGLKHRRDRSNRDVHFTRNWIRREVLPLLAGRNPRVREHLCGIADQVRRLSHGGKDILGP